LWTFLAAATASLIVAFVPTIGARIGIPFSQDAIDGWPAVFVPLGVAFLGAAFGAIAWGIVAVNRGRDGRASRYLLPSRAGVIETSSRALLVVFVGASTAFALAFGVMGAVLVARALA
jgi:hypothetical protein